MFSELSANQTNNFNNYENICQLNNDNNNINNTEPNINNDNSNDDKFSEIERDDFYIPNDEFKNNEYEFINDIQNYLDKNNYPDFNLIIRLYYNKFKNNLLNINSYIGIYIISFIYILLLLFLFLGWLLPNKLLVYYIFLYDIFAKFRK